MEVKSYLENWKLYSTKALMKYCQLLESYWYWNDWFVLCFNIVCYNPVLCVSVLETRYRYSWTWNWALVSWGVHVKCLQQCHLHSFPFPPTNVTCNRNLVLLIKFIKIRFVSPSNVTLKAVSLEPKWWTQMDNFVVSARNIYFW